MALLSEVDTRIKTLEKELYGLRSHHNRLIPLCVLPTELLVHIIRMLQFQNDDTASHFTRSLGSYDARWTRVMLTCTHIRAISVGTPTLWSFIECHVDRTWERLCLERCGDSPLQLVVANLHGQTSAGLTNVIDSVRTLFPRCRSARFTLTTMEAHPKVMEILDQLAPRLTELHLVGHDDCPALKLTANLLDGHCSALRSLVLLNIASAVDPPHLPWLQNLAYGTGHILTPADLQNFVRLLRRVPALRDLSLVVASKCYESVNLQDVVIEGSLELPCLRSLHIVDCTERVGAFLRFLPRPSDAMHIHIAQLPQVDQDIWSPPGNAHHAAIFTAALYFYKDKAGSDDLPSGLVTSARADRAPPYSRPRNVISFTSPHFSLSCPCRIFNAHPLVAQVKTLHLKGDRVGPSLSPYDGSGAVHLTGLQKIVLDSPGTDRQLRSIELFLKDRAKIHGPVEEIEVLNPTEKIVLGNKAKDFVRRVLKAKAAASVVVITSA